MTWLKKASMASPRDITALLNEIPILALDHALDRLEQVDAEAWLTRELGSEVRP
jgi:hypothetical protein